MKELRVSRNTEIAKYQRKQRAVRTQKDKEMGKNYQLQYHFGISLSQYTELLEQQKYRCAICEKPHGEDTHAGNRRKGLGVDHCHVTKAIRGLLCGNCNRALGYLQDSPQLLRKAADYLERAAVYKGRAKVEADTLLEELVSN